jgi:8-oxo-dGTP pyrophosphatase MutT (NUDIX family)
MCETPGAKRRAGVLCFRAADPTSEVNGFEFLLISRQSRMRQVEVVETSEDDRYTIPAGKFEADLDSSSEACALREGLEEAGIECNLVQDLGSFASRSKHDQSLSYCDSLYVSKDVRSGAILHI